MADSHDDLHGYDFDEPSLPGGGEDARAISGRTTRRLFAGMCLGLFVMAIFLSKLFFQEVRGLPPGGIEDRVVELSERWHEQMGSLKIDLVVAGIRQEIESWQDVTWEEVACILENLTPSGSGNEVETGLQSTDSGCPG